MARSSSKSQPGETALQGGRLYAAVGAAFLLVSLFVHGPSLGGPFVSDDLYYLVANPWVKEPSPGHLAEILDPRSDVTMMVANYAPTHLLIHAVQWQAFGDWMTGYHLTNIVLHALGSLLLVALLLEAGLGTVAAVAGGAFFLVHPANVEAVGWISQVKTVASLVFMLAALLLRNRHPVAATLTFALSLTAKAMAAIALPVAIAMEWLRAPERDEPIGWKTLAAWSAVFVGFALTQFAAFQHANQSVAPVSDDLLVRFCTTAWIGGRYLAMAATGWGVSAFHEPDPITTLLNPWVVFALVAGVLLAARTVWALLQRREEAAWWLLAAGSFVPVAQIFPFLYPMADRYLYFILPGLIGGVLLCGRDVLAGLVPERRRIAERAALAVALAVLAGFSVWSHQRAALWHADVLLLTDSMLHYPEGPTAHYYRARTAAQEGNSKAALASLRIATSDNRRGIENLLDEPAFAPLRGDPEFQALVRELALRRIREMQGAERLTEANLMRLARAYDARAEYAAEIEVLERALALDGPYAPQLRSLLAAAQRAQARGR
jgi:hypothetical protein